MDLGTKAQPFVPRFSILYFSAAKSIERDTRFDFGSFFVFQNDTMQVVWQYHVEEPVSAAGILPDHGAVRGSRPLYLVQRDAQPRRSSRNQETESPLEIWDILNKQVSCRSFIFTLTFKFSYSWNMFREISSFWDIINTIRRFCQDKYLTNEIN